MISVTTVRWPAVFAVALGFEHSEICRQGVRNRAGAAFV
jgi:hypothetical protein